MKAKVFEVSLRALSALMPYGKKMTDEEVQFIWMLLPQVVKDTVTDDMWGYACTQRRLDPSPNKELSLDLQLLSYVYRQRDGIPAFDWGLKPDLPQRMALSAQFHSSSDPRSIQTQQSLPPATNPMVQSLL